MHTYASSTLHNPVTLTFDNLTSGSMHAKVLPQSICTPSLVLIACYFSCIAWTHAQTHKVRDTTNDSIHALATAAIGNQEEHYKNNTLSINLFFYNVHIDY